jgi:uncharacterized protein YndB with AHSA1/START domain
MENQGFKTTFLVNATPQQVFAAVANVRGWWSDNIEGPTDQLDGEFLYHYEDVHRCKMKVTELIPNEKVAWQVLDNYFKFTEDQSEWTGDTILFEISAKDGSTQLDFTHQGLVPDYECFDICHDAWTHYIQGSLRDLILKGKGSPTPREGITASTVSADKKRPESPDTKSIYHRLLIKSPVETVFEALTKQEGLAGGWTSHTTAAPEMGSIARFRFEPDYVKEMKILELQAYRKVKWECINGYEEWIGTTVSFDLEPHVKGTILLFRHGGWQNYSQDFASCSFDWALFLRSLRLLCETGKGLPYPDFEK